MHQPGGTREKEGRRRISSAGDICRCTMEWIALPKSTHAEEPRCAKNKPGKFHNEDWYISRIGRDTKVKQHAALGETSPAPSASTGRDCQPSRFHSECHGTNNPTISWRKKTRSEDASTTPASGLLMLQEVKQRIRLQDKRGKCMGGFSSILIVACLRFRLSCSRRSFLSIDASTLSTNTLVGSRHEDADGSPTKKHAAAATKRR